ncbi:hypothetical protein NJ76_07620 [Rhodococcus sp. IITR03]|nr:hypothetical protein NJ76_07620 [Rhodococcus sp. IITR03]
MRPRRLRRRAPRLDQRCKCLVDRLWGTTVEGERRPASGRRLELRIEAADGLDGVPHQAQTTGESDLEVRYLGCFGGQVEAEHAIAREGAIEIGDDEPHCGEMNGHGPTVGPWTCGRLERFGHVIRTRRTRSLG